MSRLHNRSVSSATCFWRKLENLALQLCFSPTLTVTTPFTCRVNAKFTDNGHVFTMEEAQAIRAELHNIQKSLSTGEQEKVELMKSLACLKDDLTRLQHSESSLDVSTLNALERLSTASQTDLSGEVNMFSINRRSRIFESLTRSNELRTVLPNGAYGLVKM